MTDNSIFSVDHDVLRRKYVHQCILSKGRDLYLDIPCLNHLVTNALDGKKRGLQIFQSLPHELFVKKLDQISRASYTNFVPTNTRILSHSSRKNEDRSYDFFVLYDINGFEISLEEQMQKRKQENQPYTEDELFKLINLLLDSVFMCGRQTFEFIDISPQNIFYNGLDEHYKYKIANFSCVLPKKLEKKYFSPNDRYYSSKLGEKTGEMLCRALLFQVGMIILHLATFEDPNELFTENNAIKEDLLIKRIESLKSRGFTEKLQSLLGLILVVKEEKRITIEELLKSPKGAQLLCRDTYYFHGKLENAQSYSGFVKEKSQENNSLIPHGLGDMLLFNNECYKGSFKEGKRDGWGICFNGSTTYILAHWENDQSKAGQVIVKNVGMLFTVNTSPVQKVKGNGTWIPLTSNVLTNFLYYEGEFDQTGDKTSGSVFYKDGGKYTGELKNDLKHGEGIYIFPPKKDKGKVYKGPFVDDRMNGEGKLTENGKKWLVKYDKGVEISRKEWVADKSVPKEKKAGKTKAKEGEEKKTEGKEKKKKKREDSKSDAKTEGIEGEKKEEHEKEEIKEEHEGIIEDVKKEEGEKKDVHEVEAQKKVEKKPTGKK